MSRSVPYLTHRIDTMPYVKISIDKIQKYYSDRIIEYPFVENDNRWNIYLTIKTYIQNLSNYNYSIEHPIGDFIRIQVFDKNLLDQINIDWSEAVTTERLPRYSSS